MRDLDFGGLDVDHFILRGHVPRSPPGASTDSPAAGASGDGDNGAAPGL